MAADDVVRVAVSSRSAGLVNGPDRSGRLLARSPVAAYVEVAGHVLPILPEGAILLPTAVRVPSRSWAPTGRRGDPVGWPAPAGGPGTPVAVGGGRVRIGTREYRAVRTWRPGRVRCAARTDPGHLRAWASVAGGVVTTTGLERLRPLVADLVGPGPERVDGTRARALVGAGPGLTPSGDDALCGLLLTLRAVGRPDHARAVMAAVRGSLRRTTSLSASLLLEAVEGYAVPDVIRLLATLTTGDLADVRSLAGTVAGIGHTSGADLLAGALGALDAIAVHPRPRHEGAAS